jgi:putative addiction module killer protein
VQVGNLGGWRSVGEGVIELRIYLGAAYRVYCTRHGNAMVLLALRTVSAP